MEKIELYDILVNLENFTDDELNKLSAEISNEIIMRRVERIYSQYKE